MKIGLTVNIVVQNFNLYNYCPYCGSKRIQTTNLGKRALAWGATAVTYVVLFPFAHNGAQGPARSAGRNVCPTSEYIYV